MVSGKVAKVARIWRNEGLAGLLGRLRYRRNIALSQIPPAPDLSAGVQLRDHGHPALAAMIADYMAGLGVPLAQEGAPVLHIGWPEAGLRLGPRDIVISTAASGPLPDQLPDPLPSLVVEHDPARLAALEALRAGEPHVLAIPPLPGNGNGDPVAWQDWAKRHRFALDRFALFCGAIKLEQISYRPQIEAAMAAGPEVRLCLSMPETPLRRASFQARGLQGFTIIDGLKRHPGWKGAASSYRAIARAALDCGLERLTIVQDDMLPAPGFADKLARIEAHFAASGADLFSGLITDVDDSFTAGEAVTLGDLKLISLNKSIGLVFNIFAKPALMRLAEWDEFGANVEVNTIDRFLGSTPGLHVLTALPPLVNHDDALQSSIWSFSNARYNSLIAASRKRLEKMARDLGA